MQQLDKPIWRMNPSQYLIKIGIHEPWIMEISPTQYAMMSERAKRKYEKKRTLEWQASINAKEEWRKLVIEAFDRGEFTLKTTDLPSDVQNAVYYELHRREQVAEAEKMKRASEENRIKSLDEIEVGDRLFDIMTRQYVTVLKKFKTSIRVKGEREYEWTAPAYQFLWKSCDDLKEAVAKGLPLKPKRFKLANFGSSSNPNKKEVTFWQAYNHLKRNSKLLKRTEDGLAEIWETGDSLITIVDFPNLEFWTKKRAELGNEKYEQLKKEILANPGSRQEIKWHQKWKSNPLKTEMICEICGWVTWRPYFEWDPDYKYTIRWMKKHREFCPCSNPMQPQFELSLAEIWDAADLSKVLPKNKIANFIL